MPLALPSLVTMALAPEPRHSFSPLLFPNTLTPSPMSFAIPTPIPASPPTFRIQFRVLDDGLDTARAVALANSRGPSTFHQFLRLPPELRLKIYSYLIAPRVVELRGVSSPSAASSSTSSAATISPSSSEAPLVPPLLHMCRESRVYGLEHYELAFSWRISRLYSDNPVDRPATVYFNFNHDSVLLAGLLNLPETLGDAHVAPLVYLLRRDDTRRVRNVACALASFDFPRADAQEVIAALWHVLDRFDAERVLVVVSDNDETDENRFRGYEENIPGFLLPDLDDKDPDHGSEGGANVMQKAWDGWVKGATGMQLSLANKRIVLVCEGDLGEACSS